MLKNCAASLAVLVLLASGNALAGKGEVTRFQHLDVDNGLPQNTVRAITQDHYGYIWIGTESGGLARYDGAHFLYFDSRSGDAQSLGNMEISDLIADGDRLWIATVGGGLDELSLRDFSFRHHTASGPEGRRLSNDYLHKIARSPDGNLWVATQNGLNLLDPITGTVKHWFAAPPSETPNPANAFTAALPLDENRVLTASVDGLFLLDIKMEHLVPLRLHWPAGLRPEHTEDLNILDIVHGKNGKVLLSSNIGLMEIRLPDTEKDTIADVTHYQAFQSGKLRIQTVLYDRRGQLWAASFGEGLYILDEEFRIRQNIRNRPSGKLSLNDLLIMSLFEDKQGNIWIGTANRGLSILNPRVRAFHHFMHVPDEPDSIDNDVIWNFSESSNGNLWIATDGGLFEFHDSRGVVRHFGTKEGLTDPYTMDVHETRDGTVWVSSRKGLFAMKPGESMFRHIDLRADEAKYPRKGVAVHLMEDSDGKLWVATMSAVFKLDTNSGEQVFYAEYERGGKIERLIWPNDMIETHTGEILFAGTHGLMLLDTGKNSFVDFGEHIGMPDVSALREVAQIQEDHQGRLWMASDTGLYVLDRTEGRLQRFDESDGLPDQKLYSLIFDATGKIWAGSNEGLARFDPVTRKGAGFTTHDGVQSNEFNWNAALLLNDGRIAMGGVSGFNLFKPEEVMMPARPHPTVITRITRFSGGQEQSHIPSDGVMQLDTNENAFSVEYTVLDFSNNENFRYRYRLHGLEEDWHETASRNALTYTNLKPGDYLLEIQGFDIATGIDHEPVRLAVRVPAAWHQTLVFQGLMLLLAAALLAALLLQHTARRQTRERLRTEAERRRVFEAMARLARVASRRSSEELIAGMLLRQLCRILDLDTGLFYLEKNHQLRLMGAYPMDSVSVEVMQDLPDALPRFFNQFMFRHAPCAMDGDDDRLPDIIAKPQNFYLLFPLASGQSEHGLLLLQRTSGPFRASDTRIVAGLAKLALAAIDNQRLLSYQQEHRYLDNDALVLSRDHFFKLAESSINGGDCFLALLTLDNLEELSSRYDRIIIRRLLRRAAARLANQCRSQDVVGRISDTEFAIALNGCTEEVAKRIISRIALNVDHLTVTTSQGKARLNLSSHMQQLSHRMRLVETLAELRQQRDARRFSSAQH